MKKAPAFATRGETLEYLAMNANFIQLYQQNKPGKPLDDLGFSQAKRYARGMWRAELEGREVRHLGELRGHAASERHYERGRAGRMKPGYEDYTPPQKAVKPGWYYEPDSGGGIAAAVRSTYGERTAERAIVRTLAHWKAQGVGRVHVAINLYSPNGKQRARLFWRGGWQAEKLAEAIGMKRTRRGGWYRPAGAIGLEDFLLEYMENLPEGHYERWGAIGRYDVFFYAAPIREIALDDNLVPESAFGLEGRE